MNTKGILILDSGGTRTDCCLLHPNGSQELFTVDSYHPSQFSEDFFERMLSFWKEKITECVDVFLYGAGCSIHENRQVLKTHFESLTSGSITIETDILGACRSAFTNDPGIVCIMGTGSVAVQYDGRNVLRQAGGLGFLLGDEGSGFMAGKRILKAYLSNGIPPAVVSSWPEKYKDRKFLLSQVYGEHGKKFISSFAEHVPMSDFITSLHFDNIADFFEDISKIIDLNSDPVVIVGSYGFYQQECIKMWFSSQKLHTPTFLQFPIHGLISYHSKFR
jgi:hypothetical protein